MKISTLFSASKWEESKRIDLKCGILLEKCDKIWAELHDLSWYMINNRIMKSFRRNITLTVF